MRQQLLILGFIALLMTGKSLSAQQPNVLWIITDDQRYDAVPAFNRMLHRRSMSELGYVESPHVDRLTEMGTTFINTYCQATGCAPSRASMHYGRYPFRSGVYQFEYYNNKTAHFRPALPEHMAHLGYQTVHIGKLGVRIKTIKNGKVQKHSLYQTNFDSRLLAKERLCDWGKEWINKLDGQKFEKPLGNLEFFLSPEGKVEYCSWNWKNFNLLGQYSSRNHHIL